jgi:hypothetical protein
MASSLKHAKIKSIVEVIEDLGRSSDDLDQITNKINDELFLHSGSTPDAELVYYGTWALSDGSATKSLLAQTDAGGNTIASTGKTVRYFKFKATSTNTQAVVLGEGASNGYELLGDGWSIALSAGHWIDGYLIDDAPSIGASATNIDLSGTGSESVEVLLIFG